MKRIYPFVTLLLLSTLLFAQNKTQTIRGRVIDPINRQPIVGASVVVVGSTQGTQTDVLGEFSIPNVRIGRTSVKCSMVGYEGYATEEFILNSVREVVLNIELKEALHELQEVKVVSAQNLNRPVNDLAYVSARSFTVEETERIPASVNDPGRMALAYPGVKAGRDENENKIIVRGNPANMGAIGLTHTVNINAKSSLKYVVAVIGSGIKRNSDTLNLKNIRFRYDTQQYDESRIAATAVYNYKFDTQTRFKAGVILNHIRFSFFKETAPRSSVTDINVLNAGRQQSVNGNGSTQTAQAYIQVVRDLTVFNTKEATLFG